MVGPVSSDDRRSFTTKIRIGFVLLVGASAGLITLQGDPSTVVLVGAVVAGLVAGAALAWFVVPDPTDIEGRRQRRRARADGDDRGLSRRRFEEETEGRDGPERRDEGRSGRDR